MACSSDLVIPPDITKDGYNETVGANARRIEVATEVLAR
jgi:hypothetical protein